MKKFILLFLPTLSLAAIPPTPFPVFLRAGFSSVLEFEEPPTRVVLGDSQSFQVERLEHSLVVKTLAPYAASNMFVYFKDQQTRLFVLTASEDAEPTYYRKFESPPAIVLPKKELVLSSAKTISRYNRGARLTLAQFDSKKDYLAVEIQISTDSSSVIMPSWDLVRLMFNKSAIVPYKLWAERKDVQKDSVVKARFVFAKPNVPRDFKGVTLIVPLLGSVTPMTVVLSGGKR